MNVGGTESFSKEFGFWTSVGRVRANKFAFN